MDLLFLGNVALMMGQVPCEFQADQPGLSFSGEELRQWSFSLALPRIVHHQWPVAPDVIWHIYSHLYCSSGDGGKDLLSSGGSPYHEEGHL